MGVPASIKINLHDQHAAAVIQYRFVASGLVSVLPQLPDVSDHNPPADQGVSISDCVLPTTVQRPESVKQFKLSGLSLCYLWEQSGSVALKEGEPYDFTVHSNNRDVAAFTLRPEYSPALHNADKIHASMSWIASTRTMTWENETLNLRLTTDTTHDPYVANVLAMRIDVARALEAIFLRLEQDNDPFCDREDVTLEEGEGG
ncbi:hypothetical protein PFICI_01998 [Pestalotiopsis fici W106-1]|uniref:Uncharacterized protein n=1 Tax=Pestalotiopsis fici (strain W106-1 / CGMCC3.15140) TaxID=1229662 RepID=W3XQC1_PESFW|nr:uncharacterized protein PFICI_01998 [Pestalotiopsis fici W106-1]ETS88170.1 hypothetical protein PFICI_01998 [Pestalotiopsis fici W106-1]